MNSYFALFVSMLLFVHVTLHAFCRQQLAAEAAKSESAAAAAAEAAAVWQEVLMQTEEDLELQAERDGDRLAAARHEAGEVCSA
jgi:hypothetical protein